MEGLINTNTAILSSSAVFIAYVLWVYFKYGVLESISHSYTKHKEKWKFFAFMAGVGTPFVLAFENWMLTLSGLLFILCGLSPSFKKDDSTWEDELHSIGAGGGIVMATTYLTVQSGQWWTIPAIALPALYMAKKKIKNNTWWTEITAFAAIGLGFLFR